MKTRGWIVAGFTILFGVGAFTVWAATNNDWSIVDFWEWVQSLMTRASFKANSITGDRTSLAASTIANFEGFSAKAYQDIAGYWTIGYGHKIVDGDGFGPDSTINEATALDLLSADMSFASSCVDNRVTVDVSDSQWAALVSLCYNIGCGNFSSSTLLRILNQGDYEGAAGQFAVWRMAGGKVSSGLENRRTSEAELFRS